MKSYKNMDEYIANFPVDIQKKLQKIRKLVREISPNSKEVISYKIPTFKLNGKNLVHFAAFKDHISFFPTSSGVSHFKKELAGYKTSKGTIQFPLTIQIPYNLIERIVKFRVNENEGK